MSFNILDWPYRDILSQAVLEMQEQGVLAKMKTKWWKEKRGGGACLVSLTCSSWLIPFFTDLSFSSLVIIITVKKTMTKFLNLRLAHQRVVHWPWKLAIWVVFSWY